MFTLDMRETLRPGAERSAPAVILPPPTPPIGVDRAESPPPLRLVSICCAYCRNGELENCSRSTASTFSTRAHSSAGRW